jgi:RNA polymerase sigma-70 factor (ECF subfamily)
MTAARPSAGAASPDAASDGAGLDAGAVEALFVRLERPLFNVVYRWVWDREEAAELVQEAFARLWQARARVRADTAGAFVHRVAVNLAASRRRWRRLREFFAVAEDTASERARPDEAVLGAEQAAAVRAAVEALPEKLRRALVLCELSELSYAEVAAVLAVPVGTVGSRRGAALARVREHLRGKEQADARRGG